MTSLAEENVGKQEPNTGRPGTVHLGWTLGCAVPACYRLVIGIAALDPVAKGGGSEDITRLRGLGNGMPTGMVNLLYGTGYTDLCYGFNVFWHNNLSVLGFDATTTLQADKYGRRWGDGFEIETLINIRIAAAGLAVAEVPSFQRSRIRGASNLSAFSDGLRVLRTILYERFIIARRGQRLPARLLVRVSGAPNHGQRTLPADLGRSRTPPPV